MKKNEIIALSKLLKLCLILLFAAMCCVELKIPETLAFLIGKTNPVTNTFTYGKINLLLTETDTGLDQDQNETTNLYEMIPGEIIGDFENGVKKDPKVTVLKDSEACWLFVKLVESDNFDEFMEYSVAQGNGHWTLLEGTDNIYYREVPEALDTDIEYQVIENNVVQVKDTVTKEMLNELDTLPTLDITAYAIQKEGFDNPIDAWNILKDIHS